MNTQTQQSKPVSQTVALAQTQEAQATYFWFLTLAAFFAGVFYFYGFWYRFMWRALAES